MNEMKSNTESIENKLHQGVPGWLSRLSALDLSSGLDYRVVSLSSALGPTLDYIKTKCGAYIKTKRTK